MFSILDDWVEVDLMKDDVKISLTKDEALIFFE